jgi:hypothetical protein
MIAKALGNSQRDSEFKGLLANEIAYSLTHGDFTEQGGHTLTFVLAAGAAT